MNYKDLEVGEAYLYRPNYLSRGMPIEKVVIFEGFRKEGAKDKRDIRCKVRPRKGGKAMHVIPDFLHERLK